MPQTILFFEVLSPLTVVFFLLIHLKGIFSSVWGSQMGQPLRGAIFKNCFPTDKQLGVVFEQFGTKTNCQCLVWISLFFHLHFSPAGFVRPHMKIKSIIYIYIYIYDISLSLSIYIYVYIPSIYCCVIIKEIWCVSALSLSLSLCPSLSIYIHTIRTVKELPTQFRFICICENLKTSSKISPLTILRVRWLFLFGGAAQWVGGWVAGGSVLCR